MLKTKIDDCHSFFPVLRSPKFRARLLWAAFLFVSCGGDSDGPNQPGSEISVEGQWNFQRESHVSTQFGSQWSTSTMTLFLSQNGNTITGTQTEGLNEILNSVAGIFRFRIPAGAVNGTMNGSQVILNLNLNDTPELESVEGTLEGDRMADDIDSPDFRWFAVRQGAPLAPSNLGAQAETGTTAILAWRDNSDNEGGFTIEVKCCGAEFVSAGDTEADVTSVRVTGLSPATSFMFRVKAFNFAGESDYSNVASATTLGPANPNDQPKVMESLNLGSIKNTPTPRDTWRDKKW